MNTVVEDKRNKLNLELRELVTIIDMINGEEKSYDDYIENTLDENAFLDQQLKIVAEAKQKLISIFKS